MGIFDRKPKRLLPPDTLANMERFGRFEVDIRRPKEDDAAEVFRHTQEPLLPLVATQLDRVVEELADLCIPVGGFAVHGAERTIVNLIPGFPNTPAWFRLLDASIGFLRANYVPPHRVPQYAWDRYLDTGGTRNDWVPTIEPPTREASIITPLEPGELRVVVQLGPNQDDNTVIVAERDGQFVAFTEARYSDDDPTRSRSEWKVAPTLYDLYLEIGWMAQIRGWRHPELQPFFPAPDSLI